MIGINRLVEKMEILTSLFTGSQAEFNSTLAYHLAHYRKNVSYLSPDIQNQLMPIKCCGEEVRDCNF